MWLVLMEPSSLLSSPHMLSFISYCFFLLFCLVGELRGRGVEGNVSTREDE